MDNLQKMVFMETKVVVIGAGLSGMVMLHPLHHAGYSEKEMVCVEKEPEVGGTWWFNRYWGSVCDVPLSDLFVRLPR